jgi:hypothetical protein
MRVLGQHARAAALVMAVLAALIVGPVNVLAYSHSGAVSWAENHALSGTENCQLSPCLPSDCASYISQVLWWGGSYDQTTPNTTNIHDYHFWWMKVVGAGFGYTDSWGGANALYSFQILHVPGGTLAGTVSGGTSTTESGIADGDLLFYDWESNGSKDHVSIVVGHGTDPSSGWFGDYIDQHTNNRKHAYWGLKPYNVHWSTTTIYRVTLSSSN